MSSSVPDALGKPSTGGPRTRESQRLNNAVIATMVVFFLNGFAFASWASRIPEASERLGLSSGQTGALLIFASAASIVFLPLAGPLAARIGDRRAVRLGAVINILGLVTISSGLFLANFWIAGFGLFLFGGGIAIWDVAQNIEGAEVERAVKKTYMPKFHAGFSAGALLGALAGSLLSKVAVPFPVHLLVLAVLLGLAILFSTRHFLPFSPSSHQVYKLLQERRGPEQSAEQTTAALETEQGTAEQGNEQGAVRDNNHSITPGPQQITVAQNTAPIHAPDASGARRSRGAAWREPRTLAIGLMVLGAALAEGTANDWVAKASVDGFRVSPGTGALVFAVFVGGMTIFRYFGTPLVDRIGPTRSLYMSFVLATLGLLVFVLSPWLWLAILGAAIWGLGAALGFPLGMSAAADDPKRAAERLSVISTIGYLAFLGGPPLLGYLGDHWGIHHALIVVAIPLILSLLMVSSVKPAQTGKSQAMN